MTGLSTLCYIEQEGSYLLLHRTVKKNDVNKDKWIGIGGHFEENESPEECLLREVKEETGYTLTSYRYRGIVTFVSGKGVTEYMSLFTADQISGEPIACDEGELAWIPKEKMYDLELWEGDRIFLLLLEQEIPFFSLKLVYDRHDQLKSAVLNGKEMELFDLLDENGRKTGLVRERSVAHYMGSLHGTVHMWVVRETADGSFDVLLQKRSRNKDAYPGCYDISSAGHMEAGSTPVQAAMREIGEELGISAKEEDLEYIGIHRGEFQETFHGRRFHDKEYSSVFAYRKTVDEEALCLQEEEIESVKWMPLSDCMEAVRNGTLESCIYYDELLMLWSYLHQEEKR